MSKQTDFIQKIAPYAKKYQENILPSVTISQAILESGWGESTLASQHNNYFGIKGEGVKMSTLEDDGTGNYYQIKDGFRVYDSLEGSFADHDGFFKSTPYRTELYRPVYTATTPEAQAKALTGTYATDTRYADKLMNIINTYNLKQYDTQKGTDEPMGNKYTIETRYTIPAGVAGTYRKGKAKPEGVVIHSSGNQNDSLEGEINYMTQHYQNAFTHAWCDNKRIVEIANTDFACWGAGTVANPRFLQIEIVEDKRMTDKQHQQAIDRQCFWAGMQCAYYGIEPSDATKNGNGTIWTHAAVSKFLGGTDHTDPLAYIARHGVTWREMYNQINAYYKELKAGRDGSRIVSIADKQGDKPQYTDSKNKTKKYATESGKIPSTKFKKGDQVTFTKIAKKWIKVKHSDGTWTQADPITGVDKKRAWKVKSLNGDGSVSVQNPQQPKAEFFAYDRDLQKIEPIKKNNSEPQKLADNEVRLDGVVYKIVKK